MPNSKQHREKASRNRAFLATIDINLYPEWAVTVAFYTVVHLVERLRTLLPDAARQHSQDHQDRMQFVQGHHRTIHFRYYDLFNAALLARYNTINAFMRDFSVDDVRTILIGQHVVEIENYVATAFTPPGRQQSPDGSIFAVPFHDDHDPKRHLQAPSTASPIRIWRLMSAKSRTGNPFRIPGGRRIAASRTATMRGR